MEEIKYSPNTNIGIGNLKDLVPERMIRVYPYELVAADKSKAFMQGNSVTVAAISQNNLDLTNENLKVDDEGNKYFEMFAGITSDAVMDVATQTSTYGQELKEEDTFTAISNWFYEGELDQIQIGGTRFEPALFTVGKPFDKFEYEGYEDDNRWYTEKDGYWHTDQFQEDLNQVFFDENGRLPERTDTLTIGDIEYRYLQPLGQQVFIASAIIEAKEGRSQYMLDGIDPEGLYEYNLINMTTIEAAFTNSRVYFSIHLGNHLLGIEKKLSPITTLPDGTQKPGISIELKTDSLISRIDGKGRVDGLETDIDLKVTEELTPLKATPVEQQDKVTMFMDWFDYDMVMPKYLADLFNVDGGITLESLKKVTLKDANGNDEAVELLGDDEIKLIQDLLSYTSAFASSFSQFERNATGSDAGKIKSDQTIGTDQAKLVALEGKVAVDVMDSLYETYMRTALPDINSIKFKTLNQIISALTRYINSTYVIGKGLNTFGEVYLPWYIRPVESLSVVDTNNNWELKKDIKYLLASNWFDLEAGRIIPKKNVNISDVRMVQAERKLTIPEVGDTLGVINKLTKPGDIVINSPKDLMYYWYLPLDEAQLETLFLNTPESKQNIGGTRVVDSGWTNFGSMLPTDRTSFIKTTVGNLLTIDPSKIHPKTAGTVQEQTSGNIFRDPILSNHDITKWQPYRSSKVTKVSTAIYNLLSSRGTLPDDKGRPLTNEEVLTAISTATGYPKEAIEVITPGDVKTFLFKTIVITGLEYAFKRYRLTGVEVDIDASSSSVVDIKRPVLYDKVGWHFYVSRNLQQPSNWKEYHLVEERGLPVSSISEVSIAQLWGNSVRVHVGVDTFELPLFNKDDETISTQRILFT